MFFVYLIAILNIGAVFSALWVVDPQVSSTVFRLCMREWWCGPTYKDCEDMRDKFHVTWFNICHGNRLIREGHRNLIFVSRYLATIQTTLVLHIHLIYCGCANLLVIVYFRTSYLQSCFSWKLQQSYVKYLDHFSGRVYLHLLHSVCCFIILVECI